MLYHSSANWTKLCATDPYALAKSSQATTISLAFCLPSRSVSISACVWSIQPAIPGKKTFLNGLVYVVVLYHIWQQVICKHLEEHLPADVCQSYISEWFWPRFIILLGYQNCFSYSPWEGDFSLLSGSSEDTVHYWENFWALLVDHIRNSISSWWWLVPLSQYYLL